jgi:hypothetical protein
MGHFESITDTTSTFIFGSRESETQESFKESSFGKKKNDINLPFSPTKGVTIKRKNK